MDKNALVIFDMAQDDSFLIEARDPDLSPSAGPALEGRALEVLGGILASYGLRLVAEGPVTAPQRPLSDSLFGSTGAALVAALAIFERFAARQFAQSPAVLTRARRAAQIYRQALLGRLAEIDRLLPLDSLIWDRENGLTRQELAALGGQGRTAVALRVILSTLPRALAVMPPAQRREGIEAFRILSEVWDILADDICAVADHASSSTAATLAGAGTPQPRRVALDRQDQGRSVA
jgi:hypothetical protein